MISKKFRLRPKFETMETLVLLSGSSIVGQHGLATLVAREPQHTRPIVLTGKAEGSYKLDAGVGAPIRFTGTGNISPVGLRTSIKGSIQLTPAGYRGSASLVSAKGVLHTSLSTAGPGSLLLYTIIGGVRHFTGVTGHGQATFTSVPSRNPVLGKFTITFQNSTS